MKFVDITEEEYKKYWEKSDQKSFLSSPKISKLREKTNWETYYLGVKEKNKLLGAVMLLSHKRHFNKYEFYSPRGPLFDYHNKDLFNFFMSNLKNFIRKHDGYVYRTDPYVLYKERDIDGNLVENGFDNEDVVRNFKSFGFKKVKVEDTEQVIWMFSLPLEGKSEKEIYDEMKSNTRNYLRKTEKIDLEIDEVSYEELDEFFSIMEETGKRKGFDVRNLEYYQNMYKLFADDEEAKWYITRLNLKKYVEKLKEEKISKIESRNALSDSKTNDGKRKSFNEDINRLDKRIQEAEDIMKETGKDIINLSGSMFMLIKPEIIYLSSGNYDEYMKFNGQYLIQWELIKYGIKHGFKKHNFYGIPADINTHPKDYGIYEFKKGFNGVVEELIGEYELPITWHYNLLKLIKKIKK